MVENLLRVSPTFAAVIDRIFPIEMQKGTVESCFGPLKKEWLAQKDDQSVRLQMLLGKGMTKSKKYYQTNRKFGRLVPARYHRTAAPRISTKGSTFHGMKKNLLLNVIQKLSQNREAVFIEIDMGAAHTRIARYLLRDQESQLDSSLKDPVFWGTQIQKAKPSFEENGVYLDEKTIKKFLKVGLYTSMNGGNPTSEDRLLFNIATNAESYIKKEGISSKAELKENPIFKSTSNCFESFELVKEVRRLNTSCTQMVAPNEFETYTIDKNNSYKYGRAHLGISRVLQGFEVVLLTVLVREILKLGGIPASLDHDGVLAIFSKKTFEKFDNDSFKLCETISNGDFKAWSSYLLEEGIPIEPKRLCVDGHLTEY